MNTEFSNTQSCYQLIRDILQDAFSIPAILFTPPYGDLNAIDKGMRAAIWTDYDMGDPQHIFPDEAPVHRIIIVKSNLGFYNILASLKKEIHPEFISVGPFRDNELSANYFTQILKESQLTPREIRSVRYMYERMPFAQIDAVTNVMKHILETFFPEFREVTPELMQFSDQKRNIALNNELLDTYSISYSEKYKQLLFDFLQHITNGNTRQSKEFLHCFLQETLVLNTKNMREYKAVLRKINEYCHLTLLNTSVHPLHILKQSASLDLKIEEESSLARLEQLPGEICHKYCLLVKNYANPECSRLTKDVIAYIQLHLEDDLSLKVLAEHFKKNSSVLSNTFSREMGMSLTSYIQQTRIQAAIKLFNTTNISVSDAATAVGYHDFSYFSKIFTKYVGKSPREYKSGNR